MRIKATQVREKTKTIRKKIDDSKIVIFIVIFISVVIFIVNKGRNESIPSKSLSIK